MKQLFWKEGHELRVLPVGAAILCLLLQVGYFLMCAFHIGGERGSDFTMIGTQTLCWVLWSFFAVLCGAGLISQEIGTGTLSFLFALPTSRRQIWLVKVTSGAVALLLCALLTGIITILVDAAVPGMPIASSTHLSAALFGENAANALLCAFGCFAVAIAISPLLDRYIGAAAVSVGTCLVLLIFIIIGSSDTPYSQQGNTLALAVVWLSLPVFTAVSYWTFTHGETLRSVKRFYAAGRAVIVGIVAFLVLFMFARSYVLAQSASAPRLEEPSVATTTAPSPQRPPLFITRQTDSQGHEQYMVQLPDPTKTYRLQMDWKVDGGRVGGSSSPTVSGSAPVRIGAWIDSNEDMLIKSVLSAQGVKVSNPGNVTFGLRVIGNGDGFTPLTLYFKHGADWSANSNGLAIDSYRPYKLGEKLTILDEILTDNIGEGKTLDLQHVPNDPSSEALFKSGAAHRITVTATIEPASGPTSR
jgi:ABC-type transport system involved in multi-copper enzyme maturation permease subunit